MATELKVPPVGESITEVVIGEWIKPAGAFAEQDEPLVVLETDKVNIDLPAPVAGVVSKILKQAGDTAQVGEVIGYMEAGGAVRSEPAAASADAAPSSAPTPAQSTAPTPAQSTAPAPAEAPGPSGAPRSGDDGTAVIARNSPSRRRELRAQGKPIDSAPSSPAETPDEPRVVDRPEELVPMTPMRRRIAQRLVQAQQSAALLTTFNEVDMTEVMALRKQHQEAFKKRHGIKLGFMSFFVKATIEALKAIPALNAELRDDGILHRGYYDIGVAVGGGKGLVVPVIRNAERLGFAEVEQTIADYAKKARANRMTLQDLTGGTFTITNGGIYGSMLSTPIVNPPQSGILGMHNIQQRPVVRDGQVVAAPMMYLALTYDHRLVDGREAVTFLVRIKECIENPSRILLEV